MVDANTTYLWQMPHSIDPKVFRVSDLVPSASNIHADTGVSAPVSVFSFSEKHHFAAAFSLS